MARTSHARKTREASRDESFLSTRVEKTSYYFLKLSGRTQGDLTVVCGGRERCLPDYDIRRDGFRYYSLEFVVEGRGRLVLDGRSHALGPGVAFGYGPGIKHSILTDRSAPMIKYFVDFKGRAAARFFKNTVCGNRPVQVADPNRIRDVFDDLERTARDATEGTDEACGLLLRLLALRMRDYAITGRRVEGRALETYQRCRALIDERYEGLSDLDGMATACRVAPEYLCRLFQRYAATSPCRYLQRRKMERAADLLQNTPLLIKQVADLSGSSDAFHFSRSFKRVHGVSPRRFVEMNRRY